MTTPTKTLTNDTEKKPNPRKEKRIAIIGGGVAGLSAAHELIKFYEQVHVFEVESHMGGKARSQNLARHFLEKLGASFDGDKADTPELWIGEHGFRLFPHTYRHVIETMKEIAFTEGKESKRAPDDVHVVDRLIGSTEGGFAEGGILHKVIRPLPQGGAQLYAALRESFGGSTFGNEADYATFVWYLLKFITSCPERRDSAYDEMSWLEYVGVDKGRYSPTFEPLLRAIPRGLNAMKAEVCSARSFGNMMLRFAFDFGGEHGNNMEQVLSGPTELAWLLPWRRHLTRKGVVFWHGFDFKAFHFDPSTSRIDKLYFEVDGRTYDDAETAKMRLASDYKKEQPSEKNEGAEAWSPLPAAPAWKDGKVSIVIDAFDHNVLAVPLEKAIELFSDVPGSKPDDPDPIAKSKRDMKKFDGALRRLPTMRQGRTAPMVGVQFYLGEKLALLFGHMFYPSSPWALTSIFQEPFWTRGGDIAGTANVKIDGKSALAGVFSTIISNWNQDCPKRAYIELEGVQVRLPTPLYPFAPGSSKGPKTSPNDAGPGVQPTVADVKREAWFQLKEALNEPGKPPRLAESMLIGFRGPPPADIADVLRWLDDLLDRSSHIDDNACDQSAAEAGKPFLQQADTKMMKEPRTPLFIHPRGSYAVRPEAQLRIPNLFLASDYVRTETDLATMEAANEAAKRAALAILWRDDRRETERFPKLFYQPEPSFALAAQAVDRLLFKAGQGHFMDLPDMMSTLMGGALGNFTNIARQLMGGEPLQRAPAPFSNSRIEPEQLVERATRIIEAVVGRPRSS